MEVQVPVTNPTQCKRAYASVKTALIDDTVICAGYAQGGKDSCRVRSVCLWSSRTRRGRQTFLTVAAVSGRFRRSHDDFREQSVLLGGHCFLRAEKMRRAGISRRVHQSVFVRGLDYKESERKLMFAVSPADFRTFTRWTIRVFLQFFFLVVLIFRRSCNYAHAPVIKKFGNRSTRTSENVRAVYTPVIVYDVGVDYYSNIVRPCFPPNVENVKMTHKY